MSFPATKQRESKPATGPRMLSRLTPRSDQRPDRFVRYGWCFTCSVRRAKAGT